MIQIKLFESEEFGNIRTATIDGVPWFVGADVAIALGYINPRDALAKHVDAEDRGVPFVDEEMRGVGKSALCRSCLLYTSDAADEL